ncbi:MAG: HDOD domain-containing protein [Betaproteobacteria bacterium]|nr:HDOD domain-containing protein [Betaproteobacteria bacterium]
MNTVAAPRARTRIGRFEILRELGRGAQGAVYLAQDSRLERQVALKTLNVEGYDATERAELTRRLVDEARIVSKLQHPNLVALFDAGEEDGTPYLVFEYVEGRTLAQHLREAGTLDPASACALTLAVLRGVAAAHAGRVLHRDLKPANIMLAADLTPRVMDFGIACSAAAGPGAKGELMGTPSYMAPETIADGRFLPASDVFSIGVLLYEMLTGKPPVKGANPYETLNRILTEQFAPPSRANARVDERLDALVMKALAKKPEDRYADAAHMAEELDAYLAPAAAENGGKASGTLEFLLRRMRHKSDFPVLSGTISAINRVTTSEREPVSALCNAILKDVALTGKLLKLVNAACFKQFGGSISTVSRAVAILGFDNVRNIAMSLLMFEHFKDQPNAASLRDEISASYFAGIIARGLAAKLGAGNAEEAFICAMFHRLGRLLVAFYLHDEKAAIERLAQARNWDEARAAREVLGLGYDELAMGVARSWNFPDRIIDSMRPVAVAVASRAGFEQEHLRVLAALSHDLCDTVRAPDAKGRAARIDSIVRRYGKGTGINARQIEAAVKNSFESLSRDAAVLGAPAVLAPLLARAKEWNAEAPAETSGAAATVAARDDDKTLVLGTRDAAAAASPAAVAAAAHAPPLPGAHRTAVMSAGIQDITTVLTGEFRLNDVLHMILETIYGAIGFKRVLLCVRDPKRQVLAARYGFGDDAEAVIRAGFGVPLAGARDIFYAATVQGADLCIEDLDAENIRAYVPDWYRRVLRARGVALFPLIVKGSTVGLIYGDIDLPGRLAFKPDELNLLKTLRGQAVLAIRQAG